MNSKVNGISTAMQKALDTPLDQIDVSHPDLFFDNSVLHYFDRLRREAPVHLGHSPLFGDYWSITKYKDIMHVDTNHGIFSSDTYQGGIAIADAPMQFRNPNFIAMDPPKHDEQRKVVSPIVAPGNLANMEHTIRERTQGVLDSLPRGEAFNWVDKVSIELTTRMLATLFDFPYEDRRLLTYWSDVATAIPGTTGVAATWEERAQVLGQCLVYFTRLWNERINAPPKTDLISMLAHSPATRDMGPKEFLGNLVLLIVGGNDTTRNSMTGGVLP